MQRGEWLAGTGRMLTHIDRVATFESVLVPAFGQLLGTEGDQNCIRALCDELLELIFQPL